MSKHKTFDSDSDDPDEDVGLLGSTNADSNQEEGSSAEEELLFGEDEDSDDGPEDIRFTTSRHTALQKVKDTLKQIQDDKQNLKDRRKKKEELYKKQKEERLSTLADSRLPEDFLEDLSSEPVIKKKKTPEKTSKELSASDDSHDEDSANSENEEFLALDRDGPIQAVSLPDYLKKPKSSQEQAEEFRQKMLYGSKVPRESVKDFKSKTTKRHATRK